MDGSCVFVIRFKVNMSWSDRLLCPSADNVYYVGVIRLGPSRISDSLDAQVTTVIVFTAVIFIRSRNRTGGYQWTLCETVTNYALFCFGESAKCNSDKQCEVLLVSHNFTIHLHSRKGYLAR
jgi:hypothetical protein